MNHVFISKNPVDDVVGILWLLFQPLLFGLIGAEVDVTSLDGSLVGEIASSSHSIHHNCYVSE